METVTVSLYKNVKVDPTYKHLTSEITADADYTMENANLVNIGTNKAIQFDTGGSDGTYPSYYDFTTIKYLKIETESTPSDIYAFVDHVDFTNPKVVSIFYTIDYWHTYGLNNLDNLPAAFVERSGLWLEDDNVKQNDAAMPGGSTDTLRKSAVVVKDMTPSVLVYYKALNGSAGGVTLSPYTVNTSNAGSNQSVSYTVKDNLGTSAGEQQQIAGSFTDVSNHKLGDANVNIKSNAGTTQSILKYKQIPYNTAGMVDLFNDDALWGTNGSNIVGAELREGIGTIKSDGSYDVSYSGDGIEDPEDITEYLHKRPFIAYKLESRFGSIDIDPAQVNLSQISLKGYDSVWPGAHTIWKVEGYPANSWNGPTSFVDGQDRHIDLFVDGAFGYYFAQRNRINAKINNFIRSYNAKFDAMYANFATNLLSTQNSNKVSKASFDNNKNKAQITLKASNKTATDNLSNSQSAAKSTLDASQQTELTNFDASTAAQTANLTRSNEKSIATLDNNLQLTNKNLDNTINTQKNDIAINFDQSMMSEGMGSLFTLIGKGPSQAITMMLSGILTGGINSATATAKLENQIEGTGATQPAGERQRAKDTNDNEKTNLNLTQQAGVDNLQNSRKVGRSNLANSQATAISNLNTTQGAAMANLTNSQKTSESNLTTSLDAELANLENGINLAVANLYNSLQSSIQTALPGMIAEAQNFINEISAEIKDYQNNISSVSGGSGFAYDSLKNYQISLNIYTGSDSTLAKAKAYAQAYGVSINKTHGLSQYFNSPDPQVKVKGYNSEYYLKTQNAHVYLENAPLVAENTISDALNNGCYIELEE